MQEAMNNVMDKNTILKKVAWWLKYGCRLQIL
jgi:hypothetical protein